MPTALLKGRMSQRQPAGLAPSQSRAVAPRRRAVGLATGRVRATYVLCGVLLLGYLISEIVRRDGQTWSWLDGWGVAVFETVLSLLCVARGLTQRRGRAAPLLIGFGLLMWAVGDFALTAESAGGASPSTPSLADAFYLTFYPLSYIGVMLLVRGQVKRLIAATWLDGAVVGLGAAAVCAEFAFHRVAAVTGAGAADVATNLAYPVGDLLLLILVGGATAVLPNRRQARWVLLAVRLSAQRRGRHRQPVRLNAGNLAVGHDARCRRLARSHPAHLGRGLAHPSPGPRPAPASGRRTRAPRARRGGQLARHPAARSPGSTADVSPSALAAATLLLAGLRAALSLRQPAGSDRGAPRPGGDRRADRARQPTSPLRAPRPSSRLADAAPIEPPARAGLPLRGPRPLQGDQRLVRPRRPATSCYVSSGSAPAGLAARRATCSSAWAATSSRWS